MTNTNSKIKREPKDKQLPIDREQNVTGDVGDVKLWAIYGQEETLLGIARAKTDGGAKRIYEERTGKSREFVHVERLKFRNRFVGFSPST